MSTEAVQEHVQLVAEADKEFARLALERGLVSQESLDECQSVWEVFSKNSVPKPLAALLVDIGLLGPKQAVELLAEFKRDVLQCPQCGSRCRLLPESFGENVKCARCGAVTQIVPVQVTGPTQPQPTDAPEQAAADADALVGQRWDCYDITAKLAGSTIGAVYKAENLELGRTVAIKALRADAATRDAQYVQRFLAAQRTIAQFNHPNIALTYRLGNVDGRHFAEMEFVDGQSLDKAVRDSGPLSADDAIRVAVDMCGALAAVHAKGMIHHDIRPDNILRSRDGVAKLIGFGQAMALPAQPLASDQAMLLASQFMAPEHWEGRELGPPADIYSLGITLYFLVTSQLPFGDTSNAMEIVARQARGQMKPIKELNPDVPSVLCNVINKLMALDTSDRFASCGELIQVFGPMARRRAADPELPADAPLSQPETEPAPAPQPEPAPPNQAAQPLPPQQPKPEAQDKKDDDIPDLFSEEFDKFAAKKTHEDEHKRPEKKKAAAQAKPKGKTVGEKTKKKSIKTKPSSSVKTHSSRPSAEEPKPAKKKKKLKSASTATSSTKTKLKKTKKHKSGTGKAAAKPKDEFGLDDLDLGPDDSSTDDSLPQPAEDESLWGKLRDIF